MSTMIAASRPHDVDVESWVTATIRPAGSFGRDDVPRLHQMLEGLCGCASLVVLDLEATRLRSARAARVIEQAADGLEQRGGCLLCINVDGDTRERLALAGHHAVLVDRGAPADPRLGSVGGGVVPAPRGDGWSPTVVG